MIVRNLFKPLMCAIAVSGLFFLSSASAQTTTVVVNDSFADGITGGAGQIGFNTTSSTFGLDLAQPPGPVDFATGNSSRTIHGLFAPQTLSTFGDILDITFDFTTPASIANDRGMPSLNEDFKFGVFSTAGAIDPDTGVAIDFTQSVSSSSLDPNLGLNGLAGFFGEIDNINAPGTDLGIRTHNVNSDFAAAFPTGRFLSTNDGFDFISGGTDDVINLLPNTDYVGSLSVQFTDATLTSFDVTVGIADAAGVAFTDTLTDSILIADNPDVEVGVNTTTFDLLAFSATTGAFGGTDDPANPGGSLPGEDNNGIDISNVTIQFTTPSSVPEPGSAMLLLAGLGSLGLIRRRK